MAANAKTAAKKPPVKKPIVIDLWSSEWPINDGLYWFYGKAWAAEPTPHLRIVRVYTSRGVTHYACEGQGGFLMRLAETEGVWHLLIPPELPKGK